MVRERERRGGMGPHECSYMDRQAGRSLNRKTETKCSKIVRQNERQRLRERQMYR